MKCPHCNTDISRWRIKKQFLCKSCGKNIVSKDYMLAIVIAFVIGGLVATPISLVFFGESYLSVAVNIMIFIVLIHFALGGFVKLRKNEKT